MKKIVIVGAGALGSHLALMVRNEAAIRVVDYDKVEHKNVLSQFHGVGGVGRNKAVALKQTLDFLFKVKIGDSPHKLTSENDDPLLAGADLVVDCLDNAEARLIVRNFCRGAKVPCLHGALAADGAFGQATWDEDFVIEDGAGAPTCEGGEHLAFICLTSSALAVAATRFLRTGQKRSFHVWPEGMRRV